MLQSPGPVLLDLVERQTVDPADWVPRREVQLQREREGGEASQRGHVGRDRMEEPALQYLEEVRSRQRKPSPS